MPENRAATRPHPNGPWVIDTRDLGRSAGASQRYAQSLPVPKAGFGLDDVIWVPKDDEVEVELLLEAVVEGVLVSGTVVAPLVGECSRCLDMIESEIDVRVMELFAYPDSATEASTDEDEIHRLVDDLIDLEPVVRDALVLALPQAPLCTDDCPGLCPECGGRRAELGPDHRHETIDPRWAALKKQFSGSEDIPEEN